jgi:hypothetical protein
VPSALSAAGALVLALQLRQYGQESDRTVDGLQWSTVARRRGNERSVSDFRCAPGAPGALAPGAILIHPLLRRPRPDVRHSNPLHGDSTTPTNAERQPLCSPPAKKVSTITE